MWGLGRTRSSFGSTAKQMWNQVTCRFRGLFSSHTLFLFPSLSVFSLSLTYPSQSTFFELRNSSFTSNLSLSEHRVFPVCASGPFLSLSLSLSLSLPLPFFPKLSPSTYIRLVLPWWTSEGRWLSQCCAGSPWRTRRNRRTSDAGGGTCLQWEKCFETQMDTLSFYLQTTIAFSANSSWWSTCLHCASLVGLCRGKLFLEIEKKIVRVLNETNSKYAAGHWQLPDGTTEASERLHQIQMFSHALLLQGATPLVTLRCRLTSGCLSVAKNISECFMPSWVLKKN